MSFNTFCNICFIKENIIKLCWEENESLLNILNSFSSYGDIVHGIVYLCIKCCNKLEEYDKFREMYLTNFLRFRYLYNEHKKQLEIRNAPDIVKQLKIFVDINVERPSGTPLIENYEAAHDLRNDISCKVEITCKESDGDFSKINFGEILNTKNDLNAADTSFSSENEIHTCYVKYENDFFNENEENDYGSCVIGKHEPNQDLFEEKHHPFTSDTVGNVIACHESADGISDLSFNPEDCVADDTTDENGSTDNGNKTTISDVVCNVCDENFSCKSDLAVHRRAQFGKKQYNCDKCNKTFTDTAKLKEHKRFHSSKRQNKCDECGLEFTQISNLNRHKRLHTGEKPYKCDECGLGFTRRDHLNTHKLTHSDEISYKYDECSMRFTRKYKLHSEKSTITGKKRYKCDECGLRFINQFTFNRHKRVHTGEKPYKCGDCGLGFTRLDHVIRHKLTHTGEKPCKCDECGLGYTRLSDLNRHKLTHTDKKSYKCDECGLEFAQPFQLSTHILTHTSEKPYK